MRARPISVQMPTATHIGGYLLARLLFQLDPSTPAGPSRVASLFVIATRSNVLSCR
jgi:hypothetical protein